MENTEKTMESALIDLFIAIGNVANQALIISTTSKQWYEYYCNSAERETVLRGENERLRAEIAAIRNASADIPVIDFPVKEASDNENHE